MTRPERAPSAAAWQAVTKASVSGIRWSAARPKATARGSRRPASQAAPAPAADASFPAAFNVERRDDGRELLLRTNDPGGCVAQVVRWCDAHGLALDDIAVRRASLEDAFIALTGRAIPKS